MHGNTKLKLQGVCRRIFYCLLFILTLHLLFNFNLNNFNNTINKLTVIKKADVYMFLICRHTVRCLCLYNILVSWRWLKTCSRNMWERKKLAFCCRWKWNACEKKSNYGQDIEGCNMGQCGWKLEILGKKILSKVLIGNFKEISVHCLREGTSWVRERENMVTVVSF